jgi:hypothetical protein
MDVPWGGRRYLPYAFTEQGVAMLSSVLSGQRAVHLISNRFCFLPMAFSILLMITARAIHLPIS